MSEEARKLRTWVEPKEVIIHTLKQKIETTELQLKHTRENINNGHFIKEQKKNIIECQSNYNKILEEFELEKLDKDIKNGFLTKPSEIALTELKLQLETEEKSLEEIKKAVKMAERNHKIKSKGEIKSFQDSAQEVKTQPKETEDPQ